MFDKLSLILTDGIMPCLKMLVDFLLGDGLFLGLLIIFLPLLRRLIIIFRNLY